MFCFHKYGKIEDGYQYCSKCGKAKVAPCIHNWNFYKEYKKEVGGCGYTIVIVRKCSKCHEIDYQEIY
jgi:hypothetical protein